MSPTRFIAVSERAEAGSVYAHVPELPEVQTKGRTLDEARETVRAAVMQALEMRQERGEPIPAEGWAREAVAQTRKRRRSTPLCGLA